jgi:hypothetical protein
MCAISWAQRKREEMLEGINGSEECPARVQWGIVCITVYFKITR